MFGVILKATYNSFQKCIAFGRNIYVKKVMKLLAFILNIPRITLSQFFFSFFLNFIP